MSLFKENLLNTVYQILCANEQMISFPHFMSGSYVLYLNGLPLISPNDIDFVAPQFAMLSVQPCILQILNYAKDFYEMFNGYTFVSTMEPLGKNMSVIRFYLTNDQTNQSMWNKVIDIAIVNDDQFGDEIDKCVFNGFMYSRAMDDQVRSYLKMADSNGEESYQAQMIAEKAKRTLRNIVLSNILFPNIEPYISIIYDQPKLKEILPPKNRVYPKKDKTTHLKQKIQELEATISMIRSENKIYVEQALQYKKIIDEKTQLYNETAKKLDEKMRQLAIKSQAPKNQDQIGKLKKLVEEKEAFADSAIRKNEELREYYEEKMNEQEVGHEKEKQLLANCNQLLIQQRDNIIKYCNEMKFHGEILNEQLTTLISSTFEIWDSNWLHQLDKFLLKLEHRINEYIIPSIDRPAAELDDIILFNCGIISHRELYEYHQMVTAMVVENKRIGQRFATLGADLLTNKILLAKHVNECDKEVVNQEAKHGMNRFVMQLVEQALFRREVELYDVEYLRKSQIFSKVALNSFTKIFEEVEYALKTRKFATESEELDVYKELMGRATETIKEATIYYNDLNDERKTVDPNKIAKSIEVHINELPIGLIGAANKLDREMKEYTDGKHNVESNYSEVKTLERSLIMCEGHLGDAKAHIEKLKDTNTELIKRLRKKTKS